MSENGNSPRPTGWYFLAVLIVLIALLGPSLSTAITGKLVDWTGETSLKNQAVAVLSTLRPRPVQTEDMAWMKDAGVNPYGANTFFEQEVEEWKLRRSMEMLRDAGVRWVRQEMPWSDIEIPIKGQYVEGFVRGDGLVHSTWEKYDRFIALCREYNLNILARLDAPPNWSRQDNRVDKRPPDNFADFGDYVYNFVSRYKGQIKYFQIWNEPNAYPEWGEQPVNAEAYTQLLKVAYLRAKEANPEAIIVAAGLAPTTGAPNGRAESDLVFLQKMYDAGAREYFDVMSVMGYGLWTGPGDRRVAETRVNFSRPLLIREIMVRNGDANKAVWMSEVGWNALPKYFPGLPTHGQVTEEQQGTYAVKAYQRAQAEWPWMGVMFFWHFRKVHDENRDQVDFYFRMVDPDFTTHPAYDAFREMANSPPVVQRGRYPADHWAISSEGDWQWRKDASDPFSYQLSQEPGDRLSFSFQGTDLSLLLRRGRDAGRLYITVDGSVLPANRLAADKQGRAYLDLKDDVGATWQTASIAAGLADRAHQVEIWTGEKGDVAIGGIVVDRTAAHLHRMLFGVVLTAGVLLALFLLVFGLPQGQEET